MRKAKSKPVEEPEPSPEERLHFLLDFIRTDISTLRPGDWLNLRVDFARYICPEAYRASDLQEVVQEWHRAVRAGLDALWRDRSWHLTQPLEQKLVHLQQQRSGVLLRVYGRPSLQVAAMSAAVDLIVAWYPQLRRCKQCQAWFLPRHGRQLFHDPACSVEARWKRFAPKRERDYHAEYARRVKRAAPGAKPQRRGAK